MPKKNDGKIVLGRKFGEKQINTTHIGDVLSPDQINKTRSALEKENLASMSDVKNAGGVKVLLKKLSKLPFIVKASSVPGNPDLIDLQVGNMVGRGHPSALFA